MMQPIDETLPDLTEFRKTTKTFLGKTKPVYRYGDVGPGVILMHEIPGLSKEVLRLAKMIAHSGFRMALPSLFGRDGGTFNKIDDAEELLRLCVNAEFSVFAADGSSPVIDWLRELCIDFATETGGNVGAIGLCISGGFALSLTVGTNGRVRAPVMGEPALPFALPFTNNTKAVHLTGVERTEIGAGGPDVMALRFTNDALCQAGRFDSYETLLGKTRFKRIEITSPDVANQIDGHAHSVLTNDFVNLARNPTLQALHGVVAFLKTNLA